MESHTEDKLVKDLQNPKTKEEAFRELIRLYQEQLYWHIRKILLNHDDTDDVLQNTFIKVFRHIDNFKGNSKLYTWLYRIATNESLSFLNKQARENKVSLSEYNEQLLDQLPTDVYFEGDTIQLKLQQAVASLPERQRLVFNMRYFEEMSYKDIAAILELSVGGLKSTYHIAHKKIIDFLKDNETF